MEEVKRGDEVRVEVSYCDATYIVELCEGFGDGQTALGTVRQTAQPPEAPDVGMDATVYKNTVVEVL